MSNNVDNRVVRMTFDNAQFEKNIKNTMKTLSEFEQKLKFSTASKGFEAIKSAADKLNFSALGKNVDAADKKISNLATNAKACLDKMQQQLDKADFSGMGSSADKAANQINKALSSIDFNSLDKNTQIALSSITNEAGKVDLSSITDAAGRVDFSALPNNVAIAIATVMDMAGDVNFDGIAKNAENAMAGINSAADKVDFTSIGLEANDAISQVNTAAGQTDFSPVSSSAWTAATDTNKAISNIDLYSIVDATDEAGRGFQTMEAIAVGALLNIGNKITDLVTGKLMQLGNSLMSPITDGLGEYQTQIGAIQTILANTGRSFDSSSDIAEVNAVLDELNTYADKTIYNFTEMVKNIGMFTAAGTDMYQSADAIKGMSNLAALQGADPTAAARAMYQTSQALSSGVVRLMDWRSLENAGMAGEIFRDVVLNAAEKKFESLGDEHSLGLVRSIQSGQKKFTDTLTKEEWLTSDILLESLTQLTYAFGDLTDETANLTENERKDLEMKKQEAEEHLKSLGYTAEEIEAVFELGDKAQKSATEVRTFTQLIDSLKEAMGSGWTETWRYILGDFKEITDVMTKLNNALTTVIGTWDNARNTILGDWADLGGHYELFGGIRQIYKKDAEGNIIEDENGNPILLDEKKYVGAFDNILEAISKPLTALRDAAAEVFGDYLTGDNLMDITEAFNDFTSSLILSEEATEGLKGIFEAVFEVIKGVSQIATHVVDTALNLVAVVRTITDPIFDIVLSIFGQTGEGFAGVIDWLLSVEDHVYRFINSGLIELADILDTIVGGFFDMLNIPETVSIVGEAIGSFFTAFTKSVDIGDILDKAGSTIGGFFIGVLDSFGLVPDIAEDTSLSVIFEKIKTSADENLSKAMDKIIDAIPGMREFVTVMSGDDKQAKVQYFIDLFKKIGDVVLPVVTALAAPLVALKDALVGLFNIAVNSKPVQDLIHWVTELKDKAINWLIELPTKIATTASNLGQAFDVLLGNTKITEVSNDVKKMVNEIGDINITTPFVLLGGGIAAALRTVITTVRGVVTELSETLFGWIDDDPKEFTQKLKDFIAGLPSTFSNIESGMKEFAKVILPDDMTEDINTWFTNTHVSLITGLGRLSSWISTTTEGSKTVPDALIAVITGGWTAMLNAIQNFDPEEAALKLLAKLDEIKNNVLTSTGGFLDYIFGFKKERVLGASGYEKVGFTFTDYFKDISENMSKGIEEAKKKISSLFEDEDESVFDKITKFFTGEDNSEVNLQIKMDNLSKNLNESARSMTGDFTKTVTDPSLSFDKISGFIDTHKNDIFTPLQGITTWFDTVLFPNTNRIFTTGLETIRKTITGWFEDIHKFLEPFFTNIKSWPEFFRINLDNVAKTIGSGLGDIINFFNSDDFSFAKMFDTIGEKVKGFVETVREKFPLIGDILGGVLIIVEPIFATLAGLISGIGDGALNTGDTLAKAFGDIPGTISSIWEGITSTFGGAWDSFLTSLDEKVPGAKATIEQVLTDINDMFNIFDGKIGESSGGILGHISEFFNGLVPIAQNKENKNAVDIIKEVLTTLWDSLNEDKLLVIATAIEKIGVGILLVNLGKFIGGLKEVIDKIFLGKEKKTLSEKMKDIAEAMAILAGSIWVISQIEENALARAEGTLKLIAGILVVMEGVELGISIAAARYSLKEFTSAQDCAKEIAALAIAMKLISGMDPLELLKAGGVIVVMKLLMEAIDTFGNSIIVSALGKKGVKLFDPVKSGIKEILAIGLMVVVLSFIKEDDLWKAIKVLGAMEVAITIFQAVTGRIAQTNPASIVAVETTSKALERIAISVIGICFGFKQLDGMDPLVIGVAGTVIGGFLAIIEYFASKVTDVTKVGPMLSTGGAFAIAAIGVIEICHGFKKLEGMDPLLVGVAGTAIDIFMGIVGMVASKVTDATKIGPMLATGGAFAIAAAGVIEICYGFEKLEGMDPAVVGTAGAAIASFIAIIDAFNLAAGKMNVNIFNMLASGGAFLLAAAGIIEICYGLKQLDGMNPDTLSGATSTIDQFLLIIGGFNTLSGVIGGSNPAASLSILASGGAFWAAAMGVVEICNGLKQLDGMNPDTLSGAASTIDQFLLIIGSFNTLSGVVGAINPLASLSILASGGAVWMAAMGLVEICNGLKTLGGMSELDLQPATNAINEILVIVGKVNTANGLSINAFGIIASGGAFWTAAMGVVEICNGLKQLDGIEEISLENASKAISELIELIGKINSSHNIFDSAITLLAGGGAFKMTANGVVDICTSLKELQRFEPISLEGWTGTITEFVSLTKKLSSETTAIATASNIVTDNGSLTIATDGIIKVINNLEKLNGLTTINFEPAKEAVSGTVEIIRIINDATSRFGTVFTTIGKDGSFYSASLGVVDICNVLAAINITDSTGIDYAKDSISKLTKTLEEIGKFLSLPIFSDGGTTLSKVAESTKSLADGLSQMTIAVSEWLNLTTDLPELLNTARESLGKLKDEIDTKAKEFPTEVSKWWKETAEPAIDSLVNKVEDKWEKSWDKISKKIQKSWDEWWKEAKKWWNDIPEKIIKSIDNIDEVGRAIINGIGEGIEDAMNGYSFNRILSNVGTHIYNKITSDLQINSPSKLMRDKVGKAIPEGIGAGLIKYSKLVNKPVLKMGGETLKAITRYFGIHSPSRLMRDKVGKYIPAGIAAGMDEYATIAVDSAEELGASVTQAVYSGLGDISGSKYGYGISPVIDMETLKTDIEVIHEMLRAKIDDIFEKYREFITEQIQSQFENETLRYEQIIQHLDEADIALYDQLIQYLDEHLITTFDDYLNGMINYLESALPDMTQQILGAFDTTNQTISGILQAINSEQQQAVDTAITDTIIQEIGKLAPLVETTTSIHQSLIKMDEQLFTGDESFNQGFNNMYQLISGGQKHEKGSSVMDSLDTIAGHTWDDDWYEMPLGNVAGGIYHAIVGDDTKSQSSLFNRTDLLQEYLTSVFGDTAGNTGNVLGTLDAEKKAQEDLSQYLNTALGGTTGGSSSALETLSTIQDKQIDANKLFSEAIEKFKDMGGKLDDVKNNQTTISDIIDKINRNAEDMSNMDVYLDSGELVGALTPAIDASLGFAADILERTGIPGGSAAANAVRSFGSKI